jgi:hypothetical protein
MMQSLPDGGIIFCVAGPSGTPEHHSQNFLHRLTKFGIIKQSASAGTARGVVAESA